MEDGALVTAAPDHDRHSLDGNSAGPTKEVDGPTVTGDVERSMGRIERQGHMVQAAVGVCAVLLDFSGLATSGDGEGRGYSPRVQRSQVVPRANSY